jgi:hypothetical protein
MTSPWKPASTAILAANAVVIPTTNLPLTTYRRTYVAVDAIIPMLASIPFRTWRRFNDPSHRTSLPPRKLIIMRILTCRKKTLRKIKLITRFIRKIADETQQF